MKTIVGGAGDEVLTGTDLAAPVALLALPGIGFNEMNAQWSPDGTKIFFQTGAIGLIPEDPNYNTDVYILDVATRTLSLATAGAGFNADQSSSSPSISQDGKRLLFLAGDSSGSSAGPLYVRDLGTGVVSPIDLGAPYSVQTARFSPDGTKIVFSNSEVPRHESVQIKDLVTGAVTLVADESLTPSFSPNSTKIAFASWTDFGSGYNGYAQIYVKDLGTGVVTQVSTSAAGVTGDREARNPVFSPDGTKLLFESDSGNLVAGDTNGRSDIFLKDLITGEVTRVSTSATGAQGNGYFTSNATFSSDGAKVLFNSNSTNLAADGLGGGFFLKDLATGGVARATGWSMNGVSEGAAFWAILSPDSAHLAFMASSPTWVDTIYLKDLNSGVDLITGGGGHDKITGLSGDDELRGEDGNDLILGDDNYFGTPDGNDRLYGGDGNDVLIGGRGNDILDGGAGDDILLTGMAAGSMNAGVAALGPYANVDGGNDQLDGGAGQDRGILLYNDRTAPVVFNNSDTAAVNTIWVGGVASGSVTNVERVTFHGGQGADIITLGAGDDAVWGLGGADVLDGGAGMDVAVYGDKTLSVQVALNSLGDATVYVGGVAEDTLRNIEGVSGGLGADTLIGDGLANALGGDNGDDSLSGGGGADLIDGGAGRDTAVYADKTQAVVVILNGATDAAVTVGGVAEDTLRNVENVVGGQAGDILTGDGADNVLDGGAGAANDVLHGAAGMDTLIGGAGDDLLDGGADVDTASYASATDGVTVTLGLSGAQDTGQGVDTLVSIEVVEGSAWNDLLTGDNTENGLIGGAGQDWLQSLNGADVLSGGDGHDSVWGGAGDDVLDGGMGDDTIDGGTGDDTASYRTALSGVVVDLRILEDQNTQGAGTDTLISIENLVGSNFGDVLSGTLGFNSIDGGGGDDIIFGRGDGYSAGDLGDVLTGGAGADTFVFTYYNGAWDRITDFTQASMVAAGAAHDVIDLSAIDANTKVEGDQAFHLNGQSGHAGDIEIFYDNTVNATRILAFVKDGPGAQIAIMLDGYHVDLTAADFIF
ncbi:MAG TPA: hypothetical protein VNZ85_08875 [Caulobacter sp.]|nr:hypothetical protein [Caulobacter sp.]